MSIITRGFLPSLASLAFAVRSQTALSMTSRRIPTYDSGEPQVTTNHAFTGRMCAASRYEESTRSDSLFTDPLGAKLAGREGLAQPMGSWILVPRTRYGDDFLVKRVQQYGAQQLVLLGAGMDARAFRSFATSGTASPGSATTTLPNLKVFEVDQQTNFDVKEPLTEGEALTVASREAVGFDFATGKKGGWTKALLGRGFDPALPTVWLLEGLLYYLSDADVAGVMKDIGSLSAKGSAVFHDAVTAHYVRAGIAPGGAPFISGSDDYGQLWKEHAGFDASFVRNFGAVKVDRRRRHLALDSGPTSEATPLVCRGRDIVLFVEAEKTK